MNRIDVVHAAQLPDPASYVTGALVEQTAPGCASAERALLAERLRRAAPLLIAAYDQAVTDALTCAVWCGQCGAERGQPCPGVDRPHEVRRARAVRRGLVED